MPEALLTAWGNTSRGDDALGPLLLQHLEAWASSLGIAERFEWIEDFQLQIDHALDLEGKSLALYIDAGQNTLAPFSFSQIFPLKQPWHTTHAMPPESVLAVFENFSKKPPCPSFTLCLRGEDFGIKEGLSAAAQNHLESALAFAKKLLENPTPEAWIALANQPSSSFPRKRESSKCGEAETGFPLARE
ncbi:MAG: homospermidine synthase [Betaproteobacteria bacterium]|nr:homospermidine synthase [Betaproteobacteria bacterium]MCL2885261.1 homospermidine synthase [Betaproteobacteria bacterium]